MLYIVHMNNEPSLPEEIGLGKFYSWRSSLKAGAGWMILVFLTDLPGGYFTQQHGDWPLAVRALLAALPVVATLLYVRSVARWIRHMDELHRGVAVESFLWALVAYLSLNMAWYLLGRAGVWEALAHDAGLHLEQMPFSNCTFIICLTYLFFGISYSILNRRYQ